MSKVRMTDTLLVDVDREQWLCRGCEAELVDVDRNYKEGCLVSERDPTEVHKAEIGGELTFAPDPDWTRIVEFYCPNCGLMVENEYLPPGHPITNDIEVDVEALRDVLDDEREGG